MKLNQVTVPSLAIEKALPFYESLGFTPIVIALPHYARLLCPDGSTTFSLHQVEKLPKGDGIALYFECENLDEMVAALEKKGIAFTEPPTDKPWLWREAHLYDPDNNKLILYYAGENRVNPPWRIST